MLFAIPNGGYRNRIEASQLKASGVIAGLPDMLCVYKRTVGIELKTDRGVLSPEQRAVHEKWRQEGIEVHVCRSFEHFQEIIKTIIS